MFDVLLQVLDDGRLTDGQGRTVDFRNAILILTSNLGSQYLVDQSMDFAKREELVMDVVRQHFKPEFLNRLDDSVMFHPLDTSDLTHIVDLQLDSLQKRLADRRLTLDVTQAAKDWLAINGFDRRTAPARCGVWCSRPSATRWPRRSCPVRSATVTPCWWMSPATSWITCR